MASSILRFKQIYLNSQVHLLRVREDLGVMELKRHSILPQTPDLELHYPIKFWVITSLCLSRGYNQRIPNPVSFLFHNNVRHYQITLIEWLYFSWDIPHGEFLYWEMKTVIIIIKLAITLQVFTQPLPARVGCDWYQMIF